MNAAVARGLQGGCFCGAMRYRAAAVFDAGYCHLSTCRRISGAAAACWFSRLQEDFALTAGTPAAPRSSAHFTRHFCAASGTHLHGVDDRPVAPKVGSRLVSVMPGPLDDPAAVPPQLHRWWADHMPRFAACCGLPTFDASAIPHPAERGRPADGSR